MHRISDIRTILHRQAESSVFCSKLRSTSLARHFESSNPAGVRNSFDRFDHDVSTFSLAIGLGFVFSLYKRDTTRVVGRISYLHCNTYSSLLSFALKPTLIFQHCLSLNHPPHTPTQPASHRYPQIYLHCLHLIYSPTYTCTACISFIPPHIPTLPASHLFPHIYLHSLHLIYSPTYTFTACISFIPPIQLLNHHHDSKWSSLQDT